MHHIDKIGLSHEKVRQRITNTTELDNAWLLPYRADQTDVFGCGRVKTVQLLRLFVDLGDKVFHQIDVVSGCG